MQRYKVKIKLANHGDSKFEFLGTWIGFAGLILVIAAVTVYAYAKGAFADTVPVIGIAFGIYWFATQINFLIYLFCLVAFTSACVFLAKAVFTNIECGEATRTIQYSYCFEDVAYPWLAFSYLTSLFIVSLYFSIGYFKRAV
ncbi:hypothetical protein Patl_1383 [Paraglaciecola sp. T6c]|uniref:hypothetical protein n=1 Tax=Pseudoalteromonas atlantica (strain T6c / ATCC BAA-1087) TaxID=3042615 RepID=UPI00005C5E06|nr:hypothetical protein [Paraglaciecola sp. T6c]ABG39908.1 hypothetical protein Patl_1383 [Paraglaciecola sp. T6c]